MVSPEEVRKAYRLFLNREPESDQVVQQHCRASDLFALCAAFLDSQEFRSKRQVPAALPLESAEALEVAVDVDTATLEKMFSIVERAWMALGETDPYWSVLTWDQFKKQNFEANAGEFFESGRRDVERLLAWLNRNGIDKSKLETCCEFGCGTARVTPWLAQSFPRVVACDISAAHLRIAQRVLLEKGCRNARLTRVDSRNAVQNLEPFDLLFSLIVFQHNPPPVMAFLLRTLLGLLKPGGVFFFQVPTYGPGYRFSAKEWLAKGDEHGMEMHILPQRNVFAIAHLSGCVVLEVQPDNLAGAYGWESTTFLLRKRTDSGVEYFGAGGDFDRKSQK